MDKITEDLYWDIGNRIRDIRVKRNCTVEQLAEKADISTKYLYQIENGRVGFSTLILCRICAALGVKADAILSPEPLDMKQDLLSEIMGSFTDEEKAYIRSMLIERIAELV